MWVNRPNYTNGGNNIIKNFLGEFYTKYYQGTSSKTMITGRTYITYIQEVLV
jgi:hypothetical protein